MNRPSRAGALLAVAISLLAASAGFGQSAEIPRPKRACGEVKAPLAVQEVFGLNLAVNRFDAWVLKQDWAKADFESWANNIRLGWEWDENAFVTNMFGHPFHGSQYFTAGRSNCLTYWESVPLAFLGSWTWEYFGEKYRPSLNDFFMTSFGGIALGEMAHRVIATIRNTEAEGAGRIGREVAAFFLSPIEGFNRLFRGQWTRVGPNPPEHDPGAFFFRIAAGMRQLQLDTGKVSYDPTILADVGYGDPFERSFTEPFDVFSVRAQISPGGGGMNLLRANGRLYQANLFGWGKRTRHAIVVNQRYDFVKNPIYSFGQQSFEVGLISRFGIPKKMSIRTKWAADAAVLGAIDAPYAGIGERVYDFGPGIGGTLEVVLERNGINLVTFYNRGEYLHSVSGASANHLVFFSGLEANIPIRRGVGIGFYASGDSRESRYADPLLDRISHQFLETRLFVSLTSTRRANGASR